MPVSLFISYSHADEKALERLHKHLAMLQRDGLVAAWYDRAILAGTELDREIAGQLERAELFIALVSPDYLHSNYCYEKEFEQALRLSERGEMRVVPVIIEPCDWLSSPLQKFMALPRDGKAIAEWTNANSAYLDVITGLRRIIEAAGGGAADPTNGCPGAKPAEAAVRRVRVKRDFDSIEKANFADQAFQALKEYFQKAADELTRASDDIRTRYEDMSQTAFTCTIVNRARRGNRDAHITVRNNKGRGHFGDINYVFEAHAAENVSHGAVHVNADDYDLFLSTDGRFGRGEQDTEKLSFARAAEWLWNQFVEHAGIEYE